MQSTERSIREKSLIMYLSFFGILYESKPCNRWTRHTLITRRGSSLKEGMLAVARFRFTQDIELYGNVPAKVVEA